MATSPSDSPVVIANWQLCGFPDRKLNRFRMCLIDKPFQKCLQDNYARIWFVEPHARAGVVASARVPDLAEANDIIVEPLADVDDGLMPVTNAIDLWFNRIPDFDLVRWLAFSPKGAESMKAEEITRLERVAKAMDGIGRFKLQSLPEYDGGANVPYIKISNLWRLIAYDDHGPLETIWTRKALANLLKGFDRWYALQERIIRSPILTPNAPPLDTFATDVRVAYAVTELQRIKGGASKLSHVAARVQIYRAIQGGEIQAVKLASGHFRINRTSLSAYLYDVSKPKEPALREDGD